jgi:hypothetical protein
MTLDLLAPPGGIVTLAAWPDPEIDACGIAVDGVYSRRAWLPVLGTTSWLVWGAVAARLGGGDRATCALAELVPAHDGDVAVVVRALRRLCAYGLTDDGATGQPSGDGTWLVRGTCPPLWDRLLARAPSPVHAIHSTTFLPSAAVLAAARV